MNRRGFLGAIAAAAAGAVVDPERALWVPGRKVISIPRIVPPPRIRIYGVEYRSEAENPYDDYRTAIDLIKSNVSRDSAASPHWREYVRPRFPEELNEGDIAYRGWWEGDAPFRQIVYFDASNGSRTSRIECAVKF